MTPALEQIVTQWGELVRGLADPMGIDPNLPLAMITRETAGDPWRVRFEPAYAYLVSPREWASRLGISGETEMELQKMSWGLMQVMGGVARELGFERQLTQLTGPELGLRFALLQLKRKMHSYPLESDWIASYNQGDIRKTPGGMYMNQGYVDVVSGYLRELRALN